MQFHVARALELLKDYLVHLAAGVGEGGGYDGQRTASFNVACRTEEALGLVHGVGIHTAGEHLAAGGSDGIVGACQTCDAVQEYTPAPITSTPCYF